MRVVYSECYGFDIGLHVFPTRKYRLVHDRLVRDGVVSSADFVEPAPASWDDLALVHTSGYLEKLRTGAMTQADIAELELPWSAGMVDGFRLMAGGTILAARLALEGRSDDLRQAGGDVAQDSGRALIVCHLGGGLHHAFPNHGEGFCPFNDVAVAVRVVQRDHSVERLAIIDLDVHHGNGTAFTFNPGGAPESEPHDDRVFTFSMHQQHNYPMWKPRGSLDIGLPDGTRDAAYLLELGKALPKVLARRPEIVFYLAGADPYEDDQLGGLRLTRAGLRQRDRMVIHAVMSAGIPLVILPAGGYARHIEDTVAIHAATVEEALAAIA